MSERDVFFFFVACEQKYSESVNLFFLVRIDAQTWLSPTFRQRLSSRLRSC